MNANISGSKKLRRALWLETDPSIAVSTSGLPVVNPLIDSFGTNTLVLIACGWWRPDDGFVTDNGWVKLGRINKSTAQFFQKKSGSWERMILAQPNVWDESGGTRLAVECTFARSMRSMRLDVLHIDTEISLQHAPTVQDLVAAVTQRADQPVAQKAAILRSKLSRSTAYRLHQRDIRSTSRR